MTNEVAGEIILEGKRYIQCFACTPYRDSWKCEACLGWHFVRNPTYVEACLFLDLLLPPLLDHLVDDIVARVAIVSGTPREDLEIGQKSWIDKVTKADGER